MAAEERLKILQESPPNSWLAFSEDESRLVSRGATYAEAVAQAEADGVMDPVLVKTPDDWAPMVLMPCA
jgi:hypothetical protein